MTETPESQPPESAKTLIGEYEAARKAHATSRIVVTAALFVVVLAFVFVGYNRVQEFLVDDVPLVADEAFKYAGEKAVLERISDQATDTAAEVIPYFQEAFAAVYERDSAKWFESLEAEQGYIHAHAIKEWPRIEEGIAQMVLDQEAAAAAALARHVSREQVQTLVEYCAERLNERAAEFYRSELLEHREPVVDRIVANLATIAESEPDIVPENRLYLLGVMVELLGVELQEQSKYQTQL